MALVDYSSSSGDESAKSESDQPPKVKKVKLNDQQTLPLPSAIKIMSKVLSAPPIDDPSKHQGRIRSFQHERGNWSTLVFIPIDLNIIEEVQDAIKNCLKIDLKQSENIHLSLTKTVVLRHHWIKLFAESLENSLTSVDHPSMFM